MVKRRASDTLEDERHKKRLHESEPDWVSRLSHELTLRVLSFLPVPDLIICQSVSRHFHLLAGDSQLWKALYYNRFVRPRASRIPGIHESGIPAESLWYSSKLSKWLDEDNLVRRGKETNWKRQYKTRHNWTKGTCGVSEVPVSPEASVPPTLLHMHDGIIFMADQLHGLRAWSSQSGKDILATIPFPNHDSPPSALTVDSASASASACTITLAVGFQDGSFTLYDLQRHQRRFVTRYSHEPSSNGLISAAAISFPYLATMTASQLLSFYKFAVKDDETIESGTVGPPRLLQSLHSRTVWPPLTLSIRPQPDTVLVSIAYSLPTYLSGWTVGIQEMRLTPEGKLLESRLASAIDQNYRPLTFNNSPTPTPPPQNIPPFGHFNTSEANQIHSKPTSLSYSHPYLLVSHPDNTLTLYLVSSTTETLKISPGNRLWGHTSSVSGAHVGGRGKAVSVSTRGDELRVWELEGGFASAAARRRLAAGELSVQLRPERPTMASIPPSIDDPAPPIKSRNIGLGAALQNSGLDETSMTRGWVGFDDDKVVVLKEKYCGNQALVIYDFT
ncbi:hypothetical protein E4T42_05466 [Aureobasidium subglaciale]|nr:hypothetical protein E4T42_05466 [Aureobasidium subglaciale]